MNIARIINGIVVNLEVADEEWLAANPTGPDGAVLIEIPEGARPEIGLSWSAEAGFEELPPPPISVPGPGQEWALGLENDPTADYDEVVAAIEAALAGE